MKMYKNKLLLVMASLLFLSAQVNSAGTLSRAAEELSQAAEEYLAKSFEEISGSTLKAAVSMSAEEFEAATAKVLEQANNEIKGTIVPFVQENFPASAKDIESRLNDLVAQQLDMTAKLRRCYNVIKEERITYYKNSQLYKSFSPAKIEKVAREDAQNQIDKLESAIREATDAIKYDAITGDESYWIAHNTENKVKAYLDLTFPAPGAIAAGMSKEVKDVFDSALWFKEQYNNLLETVKYAGPSIFEQFVAMLKKLFGF